MAYMDVNGAIVANTVYSDGQLVAKDVALTLPEVAPVTTEVIAGGNTDLPVTGWTDPMEATITKIGIDKGLTHLLRQQSQSVEFRWVQDVMQSDGTKIQVGMKAFLRCLPKVIPGLSVTPGENSENEITLSVLRYELMVNNQQQWLIDKLNNIFIVEGVDYAKNINSML